MKNIIINTFFALGGLSVLSIILARIFPDEKVKNFSEDIFIKIMYFCNNKIVPFAEKLGRLLTGFGNIKLGRMWEVIEAQFIHSFDLLYFSWREQWKKEFNTQSLFEKSYLAFKRGLKINNKT